MWLGGGLLSDTVCRAVGTGGQGGQLTSILADQLKLGYSEKATKFDKIFL